jgi:C4-dicarboxylate-specific signal transduction histidine kinase
MNEDIQRETADAERETSDARFGFIGKILSLYTHEVKNHLAVINESVGLIGDILEFNTGPSRDPAQMLEIVQNVKAAIKRSSEFTGFLNRFAHRMDAPISSFNAGDVVEEVAALLHKAAAQNMVVVAIRTAADLPPAANNPSMLQFILWLFLFGAITGVEVNSTITVRTQKSQRGLTVLITTGGKMTRPGGGRKSLCSDEVFAHAVQRTGITVTETDEAVEISIPASLQHAVNGSLS